MPATPSLSPHTLPVLLAAYWHARRDAPFARHLLMWPLFWTALVGVICLAAASMGLAYIVHRTASESEADSVLYSALAVFWAGVCAALVVTLLYIAVVDMVADTPAPTTTGFGFGHLHLLWALSGTTLVHQITFLVSIVLTHDPVLSLSYAGQALLWACLLLAAGAIAGFTALAFLVEMHALFSQRYTIPASRAHAPGADLRLARMWAHKTTLFRRQALWTAPVFLAALASYAISWRLPSPSSGAVNVAGGALLIHSLLALLLARPRWVTTRRALWAWTAPVWISACFAITWVVSHDLDAAFRAVSTWAFIPPIGLVGAWTWHKTRTAARKARQRFIHTATEGMSAHQRLSLHRGKG